MSSECSASTPAVRYSVPAASGAATTTSSPPIAHRELAGLGQLAPLVVERARPAACSCRRSPPGCGGPGRRSAAPSSRSRPPGRSPAASARASDVQQVEQLGRVADRLAHDGDRHRVVEVAPGRGVGQQQVVAHQPDDRGEVVAGVAHPPGDRSRRARPRRPSGRRPGSPCRCRAAARRRSSRSRRSTSPSCSAAAGRGLEQVPVDGEAVHRVVLGPAAHRVPLRDQRGEQAGLVERLEHRRPRGSPGAEQGQRSRRSAAAGHGVRQRRRTRRPAARARTAAIGRSCSAAARATRSTSAGSAHGSASRASTTSPSCATTSLASADPLGPAAAATRRGSRRRAGCDRLRCGLDPAPGRRRVA